MSKTRPIYKETLFGILSIQEIENLIMDRLTIAKLWIYNEHDKINIESGIFSQLHDKLCGGIFANAGVYRTHNVTVGEFHPPVYPMIASLMKDVEDDMTYRISHLSSDNDKKDYIASIMRRFLEVHPFFDYNGRVARLWGELAMLKLGLPLSDFSGSTRKAYTQAMQYATQTKDLSQIITLL